ncbi:hypothetical protein SAY87_027644 [Trapa incisa]|uniref:Uncharacterized protein n=1 Tax=Trapa incisa TaxID=236973 RepID=A0AAN7JMT6_9MYRT|nr:hypothetical protein SAY87_027644 [Trapa incisa]
MCRFVPKDHGEGIWGVHAGYEFNSDGQVAGAKPTGRGHVTGAGHGELSLCRMMIWLKILDGDMAVILLGGLPYLAAGVGSSQVSPHSPSSQRRRRNKSNGI